MDLSLNTKLSTKQIAALSIVGAAALAVMMSGGTGWPTFAAWLMLWASAAWMIDSTSVIVRFGGSLIVSLVLLLGILMGARGLGAMRAQGVEASRRNDVAAASQATAPATRQQDPPDESPARPQAASASPSAKEVASKIGAGAAEARLIEKLSSRYHVEPIVIGDKAAKAAELCLGGGDRIATNPRKAVRLVSDSLRFAETASRDGAALDKLPLDDAFVIFVTMRCPR